MENSQNYTALCHDVAICIGNALNEYEEKYALTDEQIAEILCISKHIVIAIKKNHVYISPNAISFFENKLGVDLSYIKSYVDSSPTLFHSSQSSGFVYKIVGCDVDGMHRLNYKDGFFDIISAIKEEYSLEYAGCRDEIFEQNIKMVDSRMDEMLQYSMLLRAGYISNDSTNTISSTCDVLASENPLGVRNPQAFYKAKLKSFLFASFAGMTASEEWSGRKMLSGEYIDVDRSGDMLYYRVISDDVFENYLYQHTYFDRPDRGELKELAVAEGKCFMTEGRNLTEQERKTIIDGCHGKKGDFGYVYQDEGGFYIVINFQIRFR